MEAASAATGCKRGRRAEATIPLQRRISLLPQAARRELGCATSSVRRGHLALARTVKKVSFQASSPGNTHAKKLTVRASEAPPEYPAHARVGVAAGGGVGFQVSGPGGRVDVSVSGNGQGANPPRGQSEVRTDPRIASILGNENAGIGSAMPTNGGLIGAGVQNGLQNGSN
jgi:hypothetical protein